ncbi:MAG: hypothetical protein R3F19_32400 [Verrucomicrobiales bacterium]
MPAIPGKWGSGVQSGLFGRRWSGQRLAAGKWQAPPEQNDWQKAEGEREAVTAQTYAEKVEGFIIDRS